MKKSARSPAIRLGALLLTTALGLSFAAPATAQWQWRDKNKQLHVSDVPPPPDIPDKDILKRPPAPRAAAPAASAALPASAAVAPDAAAPPTVAPQASGNRLEAEAEARRAKAEQEEKAKRKAAEEANAAARAQNCVRAKQQLATIDSGLRIARTNEKGEREILDDKGRAEETRRTREIIASECN